MRRPSSLVLSYFVTAVTIASAAFAANTAIAPVSKAANAPWMAQHQAINERVKQGHIDLIYVGDSIVQYYDKQGKDTWDRYYAPPQRVEFGHQRGSHRTRPVAPRPRQRNCFTMLSA